MSPQKQAEAAYTIAEAAELKSVSAGYIRAAIKATEGHILRAVNVGSAAQPRYRINASQLEAWWDGLDEA